MSPTSRDSLEYQPQLRPYCFTYTKGTWDTVEIQHKCYRGEELVPTLPLPVWAPNWRTFSSRTTDPAWTGAWKVEVGAAAAGQVLHAVSYTVEQGRTGGGGDRPERP